MYILHHFFHRAILDLCPAVAVFRCRTPFSSWYSLLLILKNALVASSLFFTVGHWIAFRYCNILEIIKSIFWAVFKASLDICVTGDACFSLSCSSSDVAMTAGNNYGSHLTLFTANALVTLEMTSDWASWVQVCIYFSMSRGILDNLSASAFVFPGLYLIVNWKSANSATHLCVITFNFAVVRTYVRGLLWVYTMNEGA